VRSLPLPLHYIRSHIRSRIRIRVLSFAVLISPVVYLFVFSECSCCADFVVFAVQFLISWNEKLNSKTHCLARNDRNRGNDDVYVLKVLTHQ